MSRVLAIGDIHAPFTRRGYRRFCKEVYDKYRCNKVIIMGDIADFHVISFHMQDANAEGALREFKQARKEIRNWNKIFPKALVCLGNHDLRPYRLAQSVNIPETFFLKFNDLWGIKGWKWDFEHLVDDVRYLHGEGTRALHPAFNMMRKTAISTVLGHAHSRAGIKWMVNPLSRLFGMDVGCGIDDDKYAFRYARNNIEKSIMACGVVINGHPYHEMMPISKGEKYSRK
jgi:hypothetical protein